MTVGEGGKEDSRPILLQAIWPQASLLHKTHAQVMIPIHPLSHMLRDRLPAVLPEAAPEA